MSLLKRKPPSGRQTKPWTISIKRLHVPIDNSVWMTYISGPSAFVESFENGLSSGSPFDCFDLRCKTNQLLTCEMQQTFGIKEPAWIISINLRSFFSENARLRASPFRYGCHSGLFAQCSPNHEKCSPGFQCHVDELQWR
jgi:hypothetical protein